MENNFLSSESALEHICLEYPADPIKAQNTNLFKGLGNLTAGG